jgi:hypothetical protein
VKIATDDAHRPVHFGRAWVEVEATRDRDSILRAIRGGNFKVGFGETRASLPGGANDADDPDRS